MRTRWFADGFCAGLIVCKNMKYEDLTECESFYDALVADGRCE